MSIEQRSACELRAAGTAGNPKLVGHAAVYDSLSKDLGGFREIIRRGAFSRSLASPDCDPYCSVQHHPGVILGRRSAGTLRIEEDARGLAFEVDLPDTQAARDVYVSVMRRDMTGASFIFTSPRNGTRWETRAGQPIRELIDVDLHEVSVCNSRAAYPAANVAARTLLPPHLAAVRRFLETC